MRAVDTRALRDRNSLVTLSRHPLARACFSKLKGVRRLLPEGQLMADCREKRRWNFHLMDNRFVACTGINSDWLAYLRNPKQTLTPVRLQH